VSAQNIYTWRGELTRVINDTDDIHIDEATPPDSVTRGCTEIRSKTDHIDGNAFPVYVLACSILELHLKPLCRRALANLSEKLEVKLCLLSLTVWAEMTQIREVCCSNRKDEGLRCSTTTS
jgi:hypothetical protein